VAGGERRQDADHHEVGADLRRLGLGVVEAVPDALLELGEPAVLELLGRDVDLEVELAELGLEVGVGDRLERLEVLQCRVARVVDEVELDLQPGHRVVRVEPRLPQHASEHVQATTHLLAVARAVLAGELLLCDLFAHGETVVPTPASRHASGRRERTSRAGPVVPEEGERRLGHRSPAVGR
jgi:hypothetical protein